jgi:hypothetical protein
VPCGPGHECISGTCVLDPNYCDPACSYGYKCKDNKCELDPDVCRVPCPSCFTCERGDTVTGGRCEPMNCPYGHFCRNSRCVRDPLICIPACGSCFTCERGNTVTGGRCQPITCRYGYICRNSRCVRDETICLPACSPCETCERGNTVTGGRCKPITCSYGYICRDSVGHCIPDPEVCLPGCKKCERCRRGGYQEHGTCIPKVCPEGKECDPETGSCVDIPVIPSSPVCPPNFEFSVTLGRCVPAWCDPEKCEVLNFNATGCETICGPTETCEADFRCCVPGTEPGTEECREPILPELCGSQCDAGHYFCEDRDECLKGCNPAACLVLNEVAGTCETICNANEYCDGAYRCCRDLATGGQRCRLPVRTEVCNFTDPCREGQGCRPHTWCIEGRCRGCRPPCLPPRYCVYGFCVNP